MAVSALLALSLSAAPASEDVVAATRAWEEGRLKRLQSEDGWLSLVGLGWLKEGTNTAGSEGKAAVVFPAGGTEGRGNLHPLGVEGQLPARRGRHCHPRRQAVPRRRGPDRRGGQGRSPTSSR